MQDYDIDKTFTKRVRKPEETLTKVLEKKKKIMEGLKTKVSIPTGRMTEHMILLRVS